MANRRQRRVRSIAESVTSINVFLVHARNNDSAVGLATAICATHELAFLLLKDLKRRGADPAITQRAALQVGEDVYLLDRHICGPVRVDDRDAVALEVVRDAALAKLTAEERDALGFAPEAR